MQDNLIERKAKTLLARVMAACERQFNTRLDDCNDGDVYSVRGSNLRLLRDEILNSYNDFIRSIPNSRVDNKISFTPGVIVLLNAMTLGIKDSIPSISISSAQNDLGSVINLYRQINDGIVYTDQGCAMYTCRGIESMVQKVIPILDSAVMAKIRFNVQVYLKWRDEVRKLYIGEA